MLVLSFCGLLKIRGKMYCSYGIQNLAYIRLLTKGSLRYNYIFAVPYYTNLFLSNRGQMKLLNYMLNEIKSVKKLKDSFATTNSTYWSPPMKEIKEMRLKLIVINI